MRSRGCTGSAGRGIAEALGVQGTGRENGKQLDLLGAMERVWEGNREPLGVLGAECGGNGEVSGGAGSTWMWNGEPLVGVGGCGEALGG